MNKTITRSSLKKLNIIAGVLHLLQGFAVIILSKEFPIPVSGNFLFFESSSQKLVPASSELFSVQLALLVSVFFFLSAFFHLFIATSYLKRYNSEVSTGINKMRWIEYSLSASVMMIAISMLVGIYDLGSLIMIFALTGVMNLMGLVMEVHNQTTTKTNWLSYWIGCLAGIVPWVVVSLYLWLSSTKGSPAPTFVYWIFVSIFIFFSSFAINMILQYKKIGPWKNYVYGERAYIILSLCAKTLLAWQVFGGTLRP